MTDEGWRWVIVGAGALLVVAVALWSRRSGDGARVRSAPTVRTDLGPGVHLFSSGTCQPCLDARRVVDSVTGGAFTEVRFEDDPARFGGFGVAKVPAVFVMGEDGSGLVWEGIPARNDLRRAILERSLPAA